MSVTIIRQADGLAFTFDQAITELYEPAVIVTNHPVESGVDVSDHAQTQPLPIVVQVLQTETPFASMGGLSGVERLQAAIDYLRSVEGQLLDLVTTKFGTFTNVLLTSYPHEVSVRRNLPITLRFQQIRIATAELVVIPPLAPVLSEQVGAPDEQDAGVQATDDTSDDPAKEARDTSTLFRIGQSAGVI